MELYALYFISRITLSLMSNPMVGLLLLVPPYPSFRFGRHLQCGTYTLLPTPRLLGSLIGKICFGREPDLVHGWLITDLDNLGSPHYLLDDSIYDPSGIEGFNLYFKTIPGTKIVASTIIPLVIPPASTTFQVLNSPPVEERRREQVLSKMPPFAGEGWRWSGTVFHDGFCRDKPRARVLREFI